MRWLDMSWLSDAEDYKPLDKVSDGVFSLGWKADDLPSTSATLTLPWINLHQILSAF